MASSVKNRLRNEELIEKQSMFISNINFGILENLILLTQRFTHVKLDEIRVHLPCIFIITNIIKLNLKSSFMVFNRSQKIITFLYVTGLLGIFFFITPFIALATRLPTIEFGNFFTINKPIEYTKFFIEVGTLTVFYILLIIIYKDKAK